VHREWSPDDVIVEEVEVETGLHPSAGIHDVVVLIVGLVVGAVDPVEDIERAVETKEEDIVAREVLDLSVSLQEDQLRDDG
jgi:hypothetical protein